MIKNYITNQMKQAVMLGVCFVVAAGGYYSYKVASIQSESPALLKIKNEAGAIEQLKIDKKTLEEKIEKLSVLDIETSRIIAERKKYEMDVAKEQVALAEIFNLLSVEYGLFNVSVQNVANNSEFLNLLDVRLLVSSNDVATLNNEEAKINYIKKMRELVILYLYKNRPSFSIYKDVEKIGNDTIVFKVIKRG